MRRPCFLYLPLLTALVSACSNPTSPTEATATSPYTVTFKRTLTPGGTASQTFTASDAGPIALTLTSTSPAGLAMGIGLGIPSASARGGCGLARTVSTQPGDQPQRQIEVDSGSYCVQVFDPGLLSDRASFSLTYVHP